MILPIPHRSRNSVSQNGHYPASTAKDASLIQPDPQVTQRASRRRFTSAEKLRILAVADTCTEPGQLGALLRSEGLYSSHLKSFRKQRDEGKLGKDPQVVRLERMDREAARQRDARRIASLEAENRKLKVLLELQKKVAQLLDLETNSDA